jgi:hypothetical protein
VASDIAAAAAAAAAGVITAAAAAAAAAVLLVVRTGESGGSVSALLHHSVYNIQSATHPDSLSPSIELNTLDSYSLSAGITS